MNAPEGCNPSAPEIGAVATLHTLPPSSEGVTLSDATAVNTPAAAEPSWALEASLRLPDRLANLVDFVGIFHHPQFFDRAREGNALGRLDEFRELFPLSIRGGVAFERQFADLRAPHDPRGGVQNCLPRAADVNIETRTFLGDLRRETAIADEHRDARADNEEAVFPGKARQVSDVRGMGDEERVVLLREVADAHLPAGVDEVRHDVHLSASHLRLTTFDARTAEPTRGVWARVTSLRTSPAR